MRLRSQSLSRRRILQILQKHRDLLARYRVKRIGLFGSYVAGKPSRASDVDLLVEFDEPTLDNFMNLSHDLERLLGRKIDMLTPTGVRSIRTKTIARRIEESVVYV